VEWDGWVSVAVRPQAFLLALGFFFGAVIDCFYYFTSPAAAVQEWNHLTFRQRIFQRIKRPAPMVFIQGMPLFKETETRVHDKALGVAFHSA